MKNLAVYACILVAIIVIIDLILLVLLETDSSYGISSLTGSPFDLLYSLTFATVGGLIAVRRPGHLVGWAMLLSGGGILLGGGIGGYAELSLLAKPELGLPFGAAAAAISESLWTPLMAGIFLLLLLFPSGRVPSRRWRPVAILVLLGFVYITFTLSTAPVGVGEAEFEPPFDHLKSNPLAFVHSELYVIPAFAVIALCLAAIVAAALDLFIRFWRSRGDEREQFKWLAVTASLLAISIPFSGTAGIGVLSTVADTTFGIGLIGIPVSVGIAILRYHLYDIDRLLNRTLVYGLLTAGLAAVYFGSVVALQAGVQEWNGGNDLAIAVTTLLVAALFMPARRRVQSAVERRFNRRAYDAARTIDAFSTRLREQVDLDTLRYELLAVVDETMQPAGASLWLRAERPL